MSGADRMVDRARKLLALAASTSFDAEARSAALQAARIIVGHGLAVVADAAAHQTESRGAPAQEPVRFTSRYDGRCRHCGGRYLIGDPVLWSKGVGATHARCRDFWREVSRDA